MSNNHKEEKEEEEEEEEEGSVIGSKLKMKFKFTNPSPQATSLLMDGQDVKKKNELQESEKHILDPTKDCPPSFSMGKRKKKLTNMRGKYVSDPGKRMRKLFSKSDDVECSHGPPRKRKLLSNGLHSDEETTPALVRAEEVQATLSSEFPSFTKAMVKSHVVNGFWMGVPGYFSREHLPRMDTTITLVDENGIEHQLKYIADKMGLSAGWRKFSMEQKLLEDDVLIFQLVEPCKFKVYVVRANDFNEVEGALSLLNLEAQIQQNEKERDREDGKSKALCISTYKRKRIKSLKSSPNKKARPGKSLPRPLQMTKPHENGYKKTNPSPYCSPNFKNLENFEDFAIMIDGLCVDSELPEDIRIKYYDLCSSRNDFIHANLDEGLNSKLIAGIICETVNISNAIKQCLLMTSKEEFENWDKTLKSFELLGMAVGFLRDRVKRLVGLAFESEGALEMRKYVEAKMERVRAEDEIVNLETKIVELKEASEKYNADIEVLKYKAESYELKFQEEVDAPW